MSLEKSDLKILTYPDKRLRMEAQVVTDFAAAGQFAARMIELMREASGIGLAATQLGDNRRIIVMEPTVGEEKMLMMLANPVIVEREDLSQESEEGCLSLPEMQAVVKRSPAVKVEAHDLKTGEETKIEAQGILAIVLQHEIDHLDGILIFDHLSRLKRSSFLSKYKKSRLAAKQEGNGA